MCRFILPFFCSCFTIAPRQFSLLLPCLFRKSSYMWASRGNTNESLPIVALARVLKDWRLKMIRDPRPAANDCACHDLAMMACLVKAAMSSQPRTAEPRVSSVNAVQGMKFRSDPKMPRVLSNVVLSPSQDPGTGGLGFHRTSWDLESMSCSSAQSISLPNLFIRAPGATGWLP